MQLININQNTLDWLNERKKYLGGSDMPTIMLTSPWRSPLQLYEEKLGICTPDHANKAYIFERGHRYEDIARQRFELKIGYDIPPQVIQHNTIPWARVSLDCFNEKYRFMGEVKYMGKADFYLLKYKGIVPAHYMPQLQYQLMCTGFEKLYFIGINKEREVASTIVKPDIEYMKKIVRYASYFWGLVKNKTPPKYTDMDFKRLSIKKIKRACHEIHFIDRQIQELLNERERLQDLVLSKAKSTRMAFDNKYLVRICDFDHGDKSLISHIDKKDIEPLGRSVRDNLQLLILDNNMMHFTGGSNGKKGSTGKVTKRKRKKRAQWDQWA